MLNYIFETLKIIREKNNLTQRQLADNINIPQSHLSKIEQGKVNIKLDSLLDILHALDHELLIVPRQKIKLVNHILDNQETAQSSRPAYTLDDEDDI